MFKRHRDIKDAYYHLDKLSHNQSLNKDHHNQILGLKKYYFHNLKGLDKQAKKMDLRDRKRYNDFDKNKEGFKMQNIDIDKIALELVADVPFNGEAVLYSDGSLAYMSQGSMTQAEFNGEVKRLGTFNLGRDYFRDFVEDYDNPTEDEKEALYEYFVGEIENILDNV